MKSDTTYDVIVIGAGHAGCEAALATSRMGCRTLLLTLNLDNVAQMSCNPAIGGLAKGHIVREIDALGGEMAKIIDRTGIQFRMLNTGRGHAVQAIRAQADKRAYQNLMRSTVASQTGLELMQGTVVAMVSLKSGESSTGGSTPESGASWEIRTEAGLLYRAGCLILSPGTFLNGQIHIGSTTFQGGRAGELSAPHLSRCLVELGFELGRLKTGTSPRLARKSIDFSRVKPQLGDDPPPFFSYSTLPGARSGLKQTPCYVAWTNPRTHDILRRNLDRSPLFTGKIQGVGPRYCPSIEDKVVKFPARDSHQIFLEPEGPDSEEIYASGISTSMPAEVQLEFVRSIEGLEGAEIMRPGYAVEYDFVLPTQLKPSLQTRSYPTLFLAGQINGTSGYEEAGAQGLIAGINAALLLDGREPLVLDRAQAYVGVMIDDLVTRGTNEPYRMFTSQAEYRLLLRHDNADERLMDYGHKAGLISEEVYSLCLARIERVGAEVERLEKSIARPEDVTRLLGGVLEHSVAGHASLASLLRRPEVSYAGLVERGMASEPPEIGHRVEIKIKYAGYIRRQERSVEQFRKLEGLAIPQELFTEELGTISKEGREVLRRVRPRSMGQASRLAGVSPADIAALVIYLKRKTAPGNPRSSTVFTAGQATKLREICAAAAVPLPSHFQPLCESFLEELIKWNKRINLISPADEARVIEQHVLDSLCILAVENRLSGKRILDVGAGAGFPGLVLAMWEPRATVVLLESRGKPVSFLRAVRRSLSLGNVHISHSRIEIPSKPGRKFPGGSKPEVWGGVSENALSGSADTEEHVSPADIVVSRAVGSATLLAGALSPYLSAGGRLVLYKGEGAGEELDELKTHLERGFEATLVKPTWQVRTTLLVIRKP